MPELNKRDRVDVDLAKMVREIYQVWDYKSEEDTCRSVHIGGMAEAQTYKLLGGRCDSIEMAINLATPKQIMAAHKHLKYYIDYMKKHPVNKCPACGQIVPAKGDL